ncbi:hypothetical protein CLF_105822, partial [Clonorchis sinensis]
MAIIRKRPESIAKTRSVLKMASIASSTVVIPCDGDAEQQDRTAASSVNKTAHLTFPNIVIRLVYVLLRTCKIWGLKYYLS